MKKLLAIALGALWATSVSAQEKLFNGASIQSPVVNADGTVTFNLYAPKAVKVEVAGDFLYQSSADLRQYLDEKGYPYEYMETEGGHIWRNWRIYLTMFAQKLFK